MSRWETWDIQGHCLEYNDESHLYICDGIIVPSVTTLLRRRFSKKYADVPEFVLKRAAWLGTTLHGAIENAEKSGDAESYILTETEGAISDEFSGYLSLKNQYGFTVEGSEMPLIIPYKGEIIAAGRMDLLLMNRDGQLGVADIKRTAKLDEIYLSYQLTLYGRGIKYCYNVDPEFYRCVWLRKKEKAYRAIRPCEAQVDRLLEEVLNENNCEIDIPCRGIE